MFDYCILYSLVAVFFLTSRYTLSGLDCCISHGRVTPLGGPPPRAALRARWGKHAAAGPAQRIAMRR